MSEADALTEQLAAALRLAAQVGSQYAEHLARRRADAARADAAGRRHEADALRARLVAERDAARAAVAPTAVDGWWDTADRVEVARAWEIARAWADTDPRLAETAARIEAQIRARHGMDPHRLWEEVRAAHTRPAEQARATAVLATDTAAHRADRPFDGPTPGDQADPRLLSTVGDVDLLAAWGAEWDSLDARALRADRARAAAGPDLEAAGAVTTADLSQGTPPAAAVAASPTRPKPRKWRRGKGQDAEVQVGR